MRVVTTVFLGRIGVRGVGAWLCGSAAMGNSSVAGAGGADDGGWITRVVGL